MRLIFILLISGFVFPQNNDTEAALYNVASNAIIGGIGALINKKPNEKHSKVFLKGLYQGALGGYINFESKRLVREFSKTGNYAYLWPSKLLNSAGSSITYNAASNRNFWERWHVSFGFNYLEYDFKRDKKLRYRVLPFALYGNIDGFVAGKLDIKRSLYAGQFIFKNKHINSKWGKLEGKTLVNTIQFDPSFGIDPNITIAHELIHVYQYAGTFSVNTFISKPVERLNQNGAFFKTYHKIFFTDYNVLLDDGISIGQELFGVEYEDLFYEREARYYTSN